MGHMSRDYPTRRACYQCGATDHVRTDCPQLKRGSVGNFGVDRGAKDDGEKVEPARAKARAFHMTTDEAVNSPDVMMGTFLVNASLARVLFDSGTNRSFVSPNFARSLHL